MRLLAEWFPEFAEEFDKIDGLYKEKRTIDEKTYQFGSSLFQVGNHLICRQQKWYFYFHYERHRPFSNGPWFDTALAGV